MVVDRSGSACTVETWICRTPLGACNSYNAFFRIAAAHRIGSEQAEQASEHGARELGQGSQSRDKQSRSESEGVSGEWRRGGQAALDRGGDRTKQVNGSGGAGQSEESRNLIASEALARCHRSGS